MKKKTTKTRTASRSKTTGCSDFLKVSELRLLRRAIDQSDALDMRIENRKVNGFDCCLMVARGTLDEGEDYEEFKHFFEHHDEDGLSRFENKSIRFLGIALKWAVNQVDPSWALRRILYPTPGWLRG